MDLQRFRDKVLENKPVAEKIALAASIIDRYGVQSAPRELNLNDETRKVLLSSFKEIKRRFEAGSFNSDDDEETLHNIFNGAEYEVKALIRTNILPLWRPSS